MAQTHENETLRIVGKNHYDVVPEIPDSWKDIHAKVLKGETHEADREKMVRQDGSTEILRWKMNPWYNSEGNVGGAVLFIEDITEKVLAQITREKNEHLLAIGEDLGNSGSFEFDLTTQKAHWSENMYRIKGFKPTDDISPERYIEHIHPEDRDTYTEGYSQIIQKEEPTLFDYRLIRPDNGKVVHLRVHGTFIKNKIGVPTALMGSVQDITRSVEAGSQIEKSQHLLSIGEKISGSGSFEYDVATGTISWSENMYKITGFDPSAEINNELFLAQVHPEDQAEYQSEFAKVFETHKTKSFAYRLIRPNDGAIVNLRVHSTLIKNNSGEITTLIGSVQDLTEVISTQKELETSEASLRAAQQTAKIGSWSIDPQTQELRFSDEMFAIHEIEKQHVNPDLIRTLVHPEDVHLFDSSYQGLMDGKNSSIIHRIVTPSNQTKYIEAVGQVVKDSEGAVSSIIGTVQDITKQHQTAVELGRSEASLKTAQQIAKVGSWEWSKGEKQVQVSEEVLSIYETQKKNLTIDDLRGFIHPEDKKRVAKETANDFSEKIQPIVEYRIVTAKDKIKHVVTSAKQVLNDEGEVVRLLGTVQDVSERIAISEALDEKENLLSEMAESINDVFWITNADGDVVLYMSPLYEEVYGKTMQSIYEDGNSWADNIHPDDKPIVFQNWMENRLDGNFDSEYRIEHPNGTTKWLHAKAFPVKDDNGKVVRMAGITRDITEKRVLQDTLKDNETVLRDIAENITEMFWLTDWENDKVAYVSPRYESLFELSVQSMYDDPTSWDTRVHPDDFDRITTVFRSTAKLGTYDEEYRLLMDDGRIKWVRDRAFPIKDKTGKVVRVAGITQEITQSKQLQNELESQEQILRQMAENITEVFYLSDWVNETVLYTSPLYEEMYELKLEDLYKDRTAWEKVVHPDDLDGLLKNFKKEAPLGTFDYEFRLVMKDGTIKWVRDRAFPIKDEKGKVVRMAGITEDVTSRKKDKEQIETLSLVASETVNGVLIQDATGKIEWTNKGFTKITGYSAEEAVGKRPWAFLEGEKTNLKLAELTYRKVKEGKPFTTENTLYSKDGKPVWVSLAVSPIFDTSGQLSRMVAIGTDISKQKELEDLQKSMLTRMETRVAERTSELEEKNQELRKEVWENQRISDELYHHNLDLKDSIDYAKRIQESILPDERLIQDSFAHGFVLFLPRDVVSGDFYWYYRRDNISYFAAIDCTGHGVPGALMSMIANELMNQAVIQKKLTDPAEILKTLNKLMIRTLRQKEESTMRDGMDLSLVVLDHDTDTLQFCGAFSSMYVFHDGEMNFYPGNRNSIGGHLEDVQKQFEPVTVALTRGDSIYLTTDGYLDQFGGPAGKKLMKKRFAEMLQNIQSLPMDEQKTELLKLFNEWKGPLNQVDDVLVAGLKY